MLPGLLFDGASALRSDFDAAKRQVKTLGCAFSTSRCGVKRPAGERKSNYDTAGTPVACFAIAHSCRSALRIQVVQSVLPFKATLKPLHTFIEFPDRNLQHRWQRLLLIFV